MKIKECDKIVFCGIGGSSMPGEIIQSLDLEIPVFISREKLPKWVNKKTLCFVISYSGNTKETISLYKKAKQKKCKIIIITSGGKQEKEKQEKYLVPKNHLPREAVFVMLEEILPILKIKKPSIKIKNKDKKKAKRLAKDIHEKIPVIYSSSESLKCLSYRWQTVFNENSKLLAHGNYFPEIAHNEIESDSLEKVVKILLLDKKTKKMKKIMKKSWKIIKLKGKTKLEKIYYGIKIGDEVSKEIASLKGIDYKETPKINSLHD